MKSFLGIGTLLLGATLGTCSLAHAQSTSVSANYTRVGAAQTLTVPFTAASGVSTSGSLSSLVEVNVSGTGFALGPTVSDAFYFLNGSPVGIYYGLNIGFTGQPFAGGQANNIQNYMEFVEGLGGVAPGTIPPFQTNNTYRFVVRLPVAAANGPLSFGVSDGSYGDNGGAYTLELYSVVGGAGVVAAPEPGAFALALPVGLLCLALRRKSGRI